MSLVKDMFLYEPATPYMLTIPEWTEPLRYVDADGVERYGLQLSRDHIVSVRPHKDGRWLEVLTDCGVSYTVEPFQFR